MQVVLLLEGVQSGCKKHPQYCDLLRVYDERWAESISGPIWETVELLSSLQQAGYRLYGLSNWSAEKFHLVRGQFEFLGCFEQIVISGEECLVKPDPRILSRSLELAGAAAADCLLIDDSLKNIDAACKLGFQVIHYQCPEQLRLDLIETGILPAN